eukprot:GHRQ01018255.1.p1 GENE.GHRQ01018255.1~~GHRQ01018255.1.p1  ORF type:complete len:148 (-),score=24.82 GHRQ01018255.1:442-822(-)
MAIPSVDMCKYAAAVHCRTLAGSTVHPATPPSYALQPVASQPAATASYLFPNSALQLPYCCCAIKASCGQVVAARGPAAAANGLGVRILQHSSATPASALYAALPPYPNRSVAAAAGKRGAVRGPG